MSRDPCIGQWWSRTSQGFWCDFCGEHLKPDFHFGSAEEWDEYEAELDDANCPNWGAPDEFDPDAI